MNFILRMLSLNLLIKCDPITYASGYFSLFELFTHPEIVINYQRSYSRIVTYPGTFANDPKIILFSELYDMDKASNEFTFTIKDRSQTSCTFVIASTFYNGQYTWGYRFYWVAIDDDRIEVIDNLNYNFTNKASQTIQFPHSNSNMVQGFITITSLGFKEAINYSLNIASIDTNTVDVSFTTVNSNLLSAGFQIVLGIQEAFVQSNIITQAVTSSAFYISPNLTILTGYELFKPYSGIFYNNAKPMRTLQTQNQDAQITNYTIKCWGQSYLNSLSHKQVWMNTQRNSQYYPFIFKKMRASKLFSYYLDQYRQKLYISELNKYIITSSTQKLQFNKITQTMTLKYLFQCFPNERITFTILECPYCTNQSFIQYCYKDINLITLYIQFYQKDIIDDYVDLVVTDTGLQITEKIVNFNGTTTHTLMELIIQV